MTRVALVEANSLISQSVREALEAESDLEIILLSRDEEGFGSLHEVRGEAVVAQSIATADLEKLDLAILCGTGAEQASAIEAIADRAPCLMVAADFEHPEGTLLVNGINGEAGTRQRITASPHPAVILLAHLLHSLREYQPQRVSGTVLLPASTRDSAGLDELFEQTRSVLNFSDEKPKAVFGQQLAFNLLPGPVAALAPQVNQILAASVKGPVDVDVQLVQSPVFHSLTASLSVDLAAASGEVRSAIQASPGLEWVEDHALLGPLDAANREEILVAAPVVAQAVAERVQLWAAMDNLTFGAASNVRGLIRGSLAIERPDETN